MNEKTKAVRILTKGGFPTPPYFVTTIRTLPKLAWHLSRNRMVDYWHLRSIQKEDFALSKRVVLAGDLQTALEEIFKVAPGAKILAQQRVNSVLSGVVAKTTWGLYVEFVCGGLKSLLRDGVTPARLAISANGRIVAQKINRQEFCYRWHGAKLIKKGPVSPPPLNPSQCAYLLHKTSRLHAGAILEWVEDSAGQMFFLDMKELPCRFLSDKDALAKGIERNELSTSHTSFFHENTTPSEKNIFVEEFPVYSLIETTLQRPAGYVFRTGGLLAHLVIYAASRGIPCIISEKTFLSQRKGRARFVA